MVTLLGVQFRRDAQAIAQEQSNLRRGLGEEVGIEFLSALDLAVDWQYPEVLMGRYHGVILGGSGDLDFDGGRPSDDEVRKISFELLGRLRPLFTYLFEHDIPTLGICYGHQIIGAFAGAQVKCLPEQRKVRSHEVRLLVDKKNYFLFSDLPDSFYAHYGHKDALDRLPEGAVLLMEGGEACRVSALQYRNNIYSVQFHPELNAADMIERVKHTPGYIPEGAVLEELFKDDPSTNTILRNFGRFVAAHAERVERIAVDQVCFG